ncbi:glycoside hydrolase family 12 protein [Sphaerobolus stellatus SS14]|nr:glycoside hydrolase family 12 protein [Sphaerobolus stellatus SS14]
MQLFSLVLLLPALFSAASPLSTEKRQVDTSQHCGQWDQVNVGTYTLFLDQWGASGATSGSQCAQIMSLSGNTIAWKTDFNWVGGNGVKSFTNIQQNSGAKKQLSAIKSIETTWKWSMSSSSIVADVAYDLFTASTPNGTNVNEIMIWLANYNAGPISSQYNSDGTPKPAAPNVTLAGHTWNLYSGSNGANNVFSFLPASGTITSFNTDILPFFTYLIQHEGVSASQYLSTIQAGTEPTTGNATLTTSSYSISIS